MNNLQMKLMKIPYVMGPKGITYLRINFKNVVEDLYTESKKHY